MSGSATEWAWANSRASNGSLTVLLAIADEIDRKGNAEMSMAAIARKARLSERGARDAVRELERLGEVAVTVRPGAAARYALCSADPGRICPPTPAESAPPAGNPPGKPQVNDRAADSAGVEIRDVLDLSSVVSGENLRSKSRRKPQPERPDVDRLCTHLAERITARGSRPPSINQEWRDSARLLLDKDGIPEERAHRLIDWCQQDNFWHRNILSMPTFRKQFDKLRLAAIAEWEKKKRPATNGHQPTAEDYDALLNNWARPLDEMEARNDPRGNDRPGQVHRPRLPAAEDATRDGDRLV